MQGDANVFLSVRVEGPTETVDIGRATARIDVHDEDRGTDKATLVMDDHVGIATDVIQQNYPVTIELGWESEHAVVFKGRVHRIGSYTRRGALGQLEFEVRDLSELLNVRPPIDNRMHSGTLEAILTQLASEAGLTVGAVAIDPMPSWPDSHNRLLNQGNRTNWALIQDVAREYGARAFVEVNSPAATGSSPAPPLAQLYFYSESAMLAQEPLGRLTLCHGWGSLINFEMTRIGTGSTPAQSATVMDPATGEVCTETAEGGGERPAPAISGGALDQVTATRGAAAARAAERGLAVTAEPAPRADATVPARRVGTPSDCGMARRAVQSDETRRLGMSARGLAMGSVFMRAKSSVEVEGHSSQATGRWYIKRVNHIIEQARAPGAEPANRFAVKTYRTSFEATR